jgi:peptidoglycan/xylan/chitin deacetylase (PgdA/CDA1 family)
MRTCTGSRRQDRRCSQGVFDLTLSFDNGPTTATPVVLDLLKAYGIRTTFFVTGKQMAVPGMRHHAERAVHEGHWVGNHTFSHSRSLGSIADARQSIAEIADAQALIGPLAHPDRLFRPYANSAVLDRRVFSRAALEYLRANAYTVVLWNAVPRDWLDRDWTQTALEQCLAQPWTLMVLHDDFTRALPALEQFLPAVKAAGARFRQDFPPACVPMRQGHILLPLDPLTSPDY